MRPLFRKKGAGLAALAVAAAVALAYLSALPHDRRHGVGIGRNQLGLGGGGERVGGLVEGGDSEGLELGVYAPESERMQGVTGAVGKALMGRVINGLSGKGVQGVTIVLEGRERLSGSGGRFDMGLLGESDSQPVVARVYMAGYLDETAMLHSGEVNQVYIWPAADLECRVVRGDGTGLEGINVRALVRGGTVGPGRPAPSYVAEVATDVDGYARLRGLCHGAVVTLAATDPGGNYAIPGKRLSHSQERWRVLLHARKAEKLGVRLFCADGKPAPPTQMTADLIGSSVEPHRQARAWTGAGGAASFRGLGAARYLIRAVGKGGIELGSWIAEPEDVQGGAELPLILKAGIERSLTVRTTDGGRAGGIYAQIMCYGRVLYSTIADERGQLILRTGVVPEGSELVLGGPIDDGYAPFLVPIAGQSSDVVVAVAELCALEIVNCLGGPFWLTLEPIGGPKMIASGRLHGGLYSRRIDGPQVTLNGLEEGQYRIYVSNGPSVGPGEVPFASIALARYGVDRLVVADGIAGEDPAGTRGQVVRIGDSSPVGDVRLTLVDSVSGAVVEVCQSDKEGLFIFNHGRSGREVLAVLHGLWQESVRVEDSGALTVLMSRSASLTIRGAEGDLRLKRVLDIGTVPVPGPAQANGAWIFASLPAGRYIASVGNLRQVVALKPGQARLLDLAPAREGTGVWGIQLCGDALPPGAVMEAFAISLGQQPPVAIADTAIVGAYLEFREVRGGAHLLYLRAAGSQRRAFVVEEARLDGLTQDVELSGTRVILKNLTGQAVRAEIEMVKVRGNVVDGIVGYPLIVWDGSIGAKENGVAVLPVGEYLVRFTQGGASQEIPVRVTDPHVEEIFLK